MSYLLCQLSKKIICFILFLKCFLHFSFFSFGYAKRFDRDIWKESKCPLLPRWGSGDWFWDFNWCHRHFVLCKSQRGQIPLDQLPVSNPCWSKCFERCVLSSYKLRRIINCIILHWLRKIKDFQFITIKI